LLDEENKNLDDSFDRKTLSSTKENSRFIIIENERKI
jgi:hypothetical protein